MRRFVLAAAGLMIATLLVYLPGLSGEFVTLDDHQYVVDNELVRHPGWSSVRRFFAEVTKPSTVAGYYQPLTMVSLMLDAAIAGEDARNPVVYHATNAIMHAVSAVLVLWIMRILVGGLAVPLIVAAFFAWHPLQVESVAWISQRKTVLASLFAFSAVAAYLHYGQTRRRLFLVLTMACYVLAGLAKPTIMLLPVALMLLDVWPLRRSLRRALPEKIPFLAVMLLMAAIAWRSQVSAAALGMPKLDAAHLPRWVGLLSYNLVLYLGNIAWPMHLSPYRTIPTDLSMSNPVILLATAAAFAFVLSILTAPKLSRSYFVGAASFTILLLPALGGVQFAGSCVADRFLYFPLLFLLMPSAVLLNRLRVMLHRRAALLYTCLAIFAVPLLILTRAQQEIWQDSRKLWFHVQRAVPTLAKANRHVAQAYHDEGDFEKCRFYAAKAVETEPKNAHYLHLLGRALTRTGDPLQAEHHIRRAISIGLGRKASWGQVSLAEALIVSGRLQDAREALQKADPIVRDSAKVLSMLGEVALYHADNCGLAIEFYGEALKQKPDSLDLRHALAESLAACDRPQEALAEYEDIMARAVARGLRYPKVEEAAQRLRRLLGDAGHTSPSATLPPDG